MSHPVRAISPAKLLLLGGIAVAGTLGLDAIFVHCAQLAPAAIGTLFAVAALFFAHLVLEARR